MHLEEQLKSGVRFLDLRIRSTLVAAHREWISDIKAVDILQTIRKFLTSHPSEFLLVRFQNANENKDDFPEYCDNLVGLIRDNRDMFYLWDKHDSTAISELTLDQLCGKVLALECAPSQYNSVYLQNCQWAYPWHEAQKLQIQDLWDGPSLEDKKKAIYELMQNRSSSTLRLNHISATNGEIGFPDAYAQELNPWVFDIYSSQQSEVKLSSQVMIFDYLTPELTQGILAYGQRNITRNR
ncbi:phospholipase [Mobiluncus mulieris]|uniref:Phospholipase n=1 Tax=Mobiluncus mulieris TaxID=2052 RepID=A0A7Y0TZ88_9ACTO|nr:phospholipase [Mobiluncus mulieris]NMW64049.1 phospholipase [Mobiluncus mulieris]